MIPVHFSTTAFALDATKNLTENNYTIFCGLQTAFMQLTQAYNCNLHRKKVMNLNTIFYHFSTSDYTKYMASNRKK